MEINLYQEEEKAFVSDGMSQYIYTDMAPELHIKNKSLNIGKYTSKSTALSSRVYSRYEENR